MKFALWNAHSIRNKTTLCSDYVLEEDIDCLAITETWLTETDFVVIDQLTLPGYSFLSVPRISNNNDTYGGGIGVLFKNDMKLQIFDTELSFDTFELACFTNFSKDIYYYVIYRLPPSTENGLKTADFLDEFDTFVDFVNTLSTKAILVGDFNVHVDNPSRTDVSHFLSTLDNTGFHQHLSGPMHKHGHTLDLIISRLEDNLIFNCEIASRLSDHHVILCRVQQQKPRPEEKTVSSCKLHTINQDAFQTDLTLEFELLSQCESVNDVVMLYDRAITNTLDKHAHVKVSVRKCRPRHPWYNHDIHTARCRRYERKWRKTRLETDWQQYVDQRMVVNNLIDNAKQTYFRNEFQVSDTKDVFKKVNFLLNKTA